MEEESAHSGRRGAVASRTPTNVYAPLGLSSAVPRRRRRERDPQELTVSVALNTAHLALAVARPAVVTCREHSRRRYGTGRMVAATADAIASPAAVLLSRRALA